MMRKAVSATLSGVCMGALLLGQAPALAQPAAPADGLGKAPGCHPAARTAAAAGAAPPAGGPPPSSPAPRPIAPSRASPG